MNITRFFTLFTCCLLFCLPAIAQPQSTLSGTIVDNEGKGLQFINVALLNHQRKIIAFATTGEQGRFSLPAVPKGEYSLLLSCMGYADISYEIVIDGASNDLGSFVIQEGVALGEVVISAQKQVVQSKVDRLIYDVSKDTSAAKSSVLQILDKIPFIQVDPATKKIKVMGEETGFSITVNGKKNLLLSEANQYVQEIMRAGNLKEIELITSPDGQYSEKNAVINFVTASSLPDGFAARVNVEGSNEYSAGSSLGLTSKIGKFVFDISGRYNWSNKYGSESWAKRTNYTSEEQRYSENYTRNNPGASHNYSAALKASYDFTPLDLLTFNAEISPPVDSHSDITSNTVYSNAAGITTRELNGKSRSTGNNAKYIIGLNYQRSFKDKPGRLFTATYKYDNNKSRQSYEQENMLDGIIDSRYISRNTIGNAEHTAGVDFYSPISTKGSYFLTGKYVHRSYNSGARQHDILTSTETPLNAMDYIQQVASIEGNYTHRWTKWMVIARGAADYQYNDAVFRPDNTSLAKGDFTWSVRLLLTYRLTATNTFNLVLNKGIFRPDIRYLNPYEDHSVPGQISKGNPLLKNADTYLATLSYRFFLDKKLNISLRTAYRYYSDIAQPYTYVDNEGMFVTTYANTSSERWVNFGIGVGYNPFSWLELSLSGSLIYRQFEYAGYQNSYWNPVYGLNITGYLWKGCSLMGYFSIMNSGGAQLEKQHFFLSGILFFTQDFGKGWRLSAQISHPWETYLLVKREEGSVDFYNYFENKILGRKLYLSLTYTFGRFKENVKTSRREITNTDRTRPE